jgi:hypothetical protein
MATFKERIASYFFSDIIANATRQALAAVSVRIDDSPGWEHRAGGAGPADRPWSEIRDDLDDTLEAWRKNFFVRHLVTLTRSYVIGNGITISSKDEDVDAFIRTFWQHPKNQLSRRLGPMCDELTRTGELFPVLFTNKVDGISYVRFVPTSRISHIETEEDDHETELRYAQITNSTEPQWWIGPDHKRAFKLSRTKLKPLMLHFAVNRPIGATRGEGDLGPILPWAKRYSEWLKDRVRLNRQRTRQALLDIKIADDTMVQEKRKQLRTSNPIEAGIYVHGPGEEVTLHNLNIQAKDVKDDGRVLRLAIATGSNTALHFLGEGQGINYATAKEMGEPTARFYTDRQTEIRAFLTDLVATAYKRQQATLKPDQPLPRTQDLQLITSVTEVARADNAGLAAAARDMVQALREMRDNNWIDDATAIRLAFKFAGEPLTEEEVKKILEQNTAEEQE